LEVLKAQSISFSYDGKDVIKDVSIDIGKGSLNLLIGPNGAGKSTLLRLLSGILKPTEGDVKIQGRSIYTLKRKEIARVISYLPQESHVVYPFSCLEIVLMGRTPWIGKWKPEEEKDLEIAVKAMRRVGILSLKERVITEISGGERQLVFLARAIAQNPQVFLLDEPASYLDMKHKFVLFDILLALKDEGKSIFLVTHDVFILQFPFDNIFAIKGGKIVKTGKKEDILDEKLLSLLYEVSLKVERIGKGFFLMPKIL